MKKIVCLSLLLACFIPFSKTFANDTDLYILTQVAQQVPPDALILLDLSGSMADSPNGPNYTLYYGTGTCTQTCQYNCGGNIAYYPTSSGSNTSPCSGSGAIYAKNSSQCSTGPLYQESSGNHTHPCSGVPSTLYYNPGNCNTTCPHNCGDNNIPYYMAGASPHTASCSFSSTQTIYGDPACAGPFYETYNYTGTSASQTVCTQSKIAIAKRALFQLFDVDDGTGKGNPDGIINSNDQSYLNIRFGYMRYYNCGTSSPEATYPETSTSSYSSGCNTEIWPFATPTNNGTATPYSSIYCNSSTSCTLLSAGSGTCIANEQPSGGTPLADALLEAKYYLNYTKANDTEGSCRQKFVILITDGDDTLACGMNGSEGETIQYKGRREVVAQAKALANQGYYVFVVGFGSGMPTYQQNTLNWAAYYGKTKNNNATQFIDQTTLYSIPNSQTAIYPSGVTQCMTSSYTNGGTQGGYTYYYASTNDPGQDNISGYAFIAQSESDLKTAISDIRTFILSLISQSTSYVAPVVPISQYQSTSSENRLYLGMFKPTTNTMWDGNIKKFGIASTGTNVGAIVDVNGNLVMDSQGSISSTAESYWSASADGGDVDKGGLGAALLALGTNLNSRNIYTYVGKNTNLTDSSNAFTKTNTTNITPLLLGYAAGDTTDATNVIDFIHGWDVYNWNNGPGNPRSWILGAFIHSRPQVIHYGTYDMIYVGANDGMLHAFKDTGNSASELWGYIPPDLLPNLKNFSNSTNSLQISVDGSPKSYVIYNYNSDGSINSVQQAILIFGERRGGSTYTALDVTNPSSPIFLWSISPTQIKYGTTTTSSTAYGEMGQSWSTPIIGKIQNGTVVAFIGGGYDATHEDTTPAGTDTSGIAVYIVNVLTGSQIWRYSHNNDTNMKYCISSDIAAIDTNGDGFIERLYVGDVGGEMWRFDIADSNMSNWKGEIIFQGVGKIFYPPDVSFEINIGSGTYNMLFFGTGDREKPNDTPAKDPNYWLNSRLYAIKDYDASPTTLTEGNLVDVTPDVLQSTGSTQTQKNTQLSSLKTGSGWFIQLNQSAGEDPNPGEKCDASAVVYGGAVYYTTFTPSPPNTQSLCTLGTGTGNIYALQYQTGNAMFDQNDDSVINVNDRSTTVGSGIPSGIVLSIINGTVEAYFGVAGGVGSTKTTTANSILPLDWRIVF